MRADVFYLSKDTKHLPILLPTSKYHLSSAADVVVYNIHKPLHKRYSGGSAGRPRERHQYYFVCMANTSEILLPVVVDTSFVLYNMNSSSDEYRTRDGPVTPNKPDSGTPNTSQSSVSPEYSGGRRGVDVDTNEQHAGNNFSTLTYLTPSRQQLNAATNFVVSDNAISQAEAKTTLCFPFDLDLVHALQNHSVSSGTTRKNQLGDDSQCIYTIDELQTLSREARPYLMELTKSREGRELQRWEHLEKTTTATTTKATGRNFIGDDHNNVTIYASQQEQQIYKSYPNCRLTTGCIPILPGGRILLITSSKSQSVFVLPKGGWEHDESLPLSALRETLEEAGVTGLLGPPLPHLTYETKKAVNRRLLLEETQRSNSTLGSATSDGSDRIVTSDSPVSPYHTHNRLTIFPMYVQCIYDHWPEMNRLRRVVSIDEASLLLQHRPEFLHMINELRDRNLHQIGETDAV